jgi:hypothetical protein
LREHARFRGGCSCRRTGVHTPISGVPEIGQLIVRKSETSDLRWNMRKKIEQGRDPAPNDATLPNATLTPRNMFVVRSRRPRLLCRVVLSRAFPPKSLSSQTAVLSSGCPPKTWTADSDFRWRGRRDIFFCADRAMERYPISHGLSPKSETPRARNLPAAPICGAS